jgi:hypothetical protein
LELEIYDDLLKNDEILLQCGHSLRGLFQKVSQMDKLSRNGNIPGPIRLEQESAHNAKMATERIEKR